MFHMKQCETCDKPRGRNKRYCSRACQKGPITFLCQDSAQQLAVKLGMDGTPEALSLLRAAAALDVSGSDMLLPLLREVRLSTAALRDAAATSKGMNKKVTVADEVQRALQRIDAS